MNATELAAHLLHPGDDNHDFFDSALLESDLTGANMHDLAYSALYAKLDGSDAADVYADALNKLRGSDSTFSDAVARILFDEYTTLKADYLANIDEDN